MPGEIVLRRVEPPDLAAPETRSGALARYLEEQGSGLRLVRVAEYEGALVGYVTLLWSADDPVLRGMNVPEVSDLWVRQEFRGRGVGSALLSEIERLAGTRCDTIGLNVGLHSGYGSAQRIYVRRGYMPDGAGVVIDGKQVPEGDTIRLDDDPVVTLRMTKSLLDRSERGPSP